MSAWLARVVRANRPVASRRQRLLWTALSIAMIALVQIAVQYSDPAASAGLAHDSEDLVENTLSPGYATLAARNFLVEDTRRSPEWWLRSPSSGATSYYSQLGAQARVLRHLAPPAAEDIPGFVHSARRGAAVIFLFAVAVITWCAGRDFGPVSAMLVALLFAGSGWLLVLSANIYWLVGLDFLPFAVSWLMYRRARRTYFPAFVAIVAAAVVIKAVCGYEFITTVVLSAAVPVAGFELFASSRTVALRRAAIVATAGIAATLIVIALHAVALNRGGVSADLLVRRAAGVTWSGHEIHTIPELRGYGSRIVEVLDRYGVGQRLEHSSWQRPVMNAIFLGIWLLRPTLSVPVLGLPLPGVVLAAVLLVAMVAVRRRSGNPPPPLVADRAAGILGLALAASLSWLAISFNHTVLTAQISEILWYIPFLPASAALLPLVVASPQPTESTCALA